MADKYFFKFMDKTLKRGKIKYENGSLYEGYIRDGKANGRGKMLLKKNTHPCELYIGDFVDDKREGEGVYNDAIGSYSGQWKNDLKHGDGHLISVYGDYKGQFADGKRHGRGKIMHRNGEIYEGDFVNNLYNGYGTYWSVEGDIYEGPFTDNAPSSGEGIIKYANGDIYKGGFLDDERHGKGRWTDSVNNRIYEGTWKTGDLSGHINIFAKNAGRTSYSILHRNIDFNKFLRRKNKIPKYYYYHIPEISKYTGRSESGIKKFISASIDRANYIAQESGEHATGVFVDDRSGLTKKVWAEPTLDQKELHVNKPSAYFLISAHGSYDVNVSHRTGEVIEEKFTVPNGVRLIFFDRSEKNVSSIIDEIVNHADFMKPSLIQRKTYRRITPAFLFSELIGGNTSIDILDAFEKTIISKTHHMFHAFIYAQNSNAKDDNTVLPVLQELGMEKYSDNFIRAGITKISELHSLNSTDLKHMGIAPLMPRKHMITKFKTLKDPRYSLSIYDSGMDCHNLTLQWNPELGEDYMKLGVYPLPNKDLQKPTEDLEDANGNLIKSDVFKGGFMPENSWDGFRINTDGMSLWNLFGKRTTELKEFVSLLPVGTVEHPCVYFVSACRSVRHGTSDAERAYGETLTNNKGMIRQHSENAHKPFLTRTLTDN